MVGLRPSAISRPRHALTTSSRPAPRLHGAGTRGVADYVIDSEKPGSPMSAGWSTGTHDELTGGGLCRDRWHGRSRPPVRFRIEVFEQRRRSAASSVRRWRTGRPRRCWCSPTARFDLKQQITAPGRPGSTIASSSAIPRRSPWAGLVEARDAMRPCRPSATRGSPGGRVSASSCARSLNTLRRRELDAVVQSSQAIRGCRT